MAHAAARAELESLLRARKLDRTLTVTHPLLVAPPADRLITTGVPSLDTALGGGVPRGQISELVGAVSSGRTAVLHRLLAQATGQGELAAVVDVRDAFDPAAAAAQGVRLDQLLWVRGEAESAVSRAIKALNLVVSAGGFGLVVFDAGSVDPRALRQLPFTTWLRVQRVLEGSDTACVLLADAPLARSTGGASVRLGTDRRSGVTPPGAAVPDFHARVRANRYVLGFDPVPIAGGRPRASGVGLVPTRAGSRACRQAPTCSMRCATRRARSLPQSHRGIWPQRHRGHRDLFRGPQRHRAHRDSLGGHKDTSARDFLRTQRPHYRRCSEKV